MSRTYYWKTLSSPTFKDVGGDRFYTDVGIVSSRKGASRLSKHAYDDLFRTDGSIHASLLEKRLYGHYAPHFLNSPFSLNLGKTIEEAVGFQIESLLFLDRGEETLFSIVFKPTGPYANRVRECVKLGSPDFRIGYRAVSSEMLVNQSHLRSEGLIESFISFDLVPIF